MGTQYRQTFAEAEIKRRQKIARKKEEKMKAREEMKSRSVWTIDNEICKDLEMDFK